VLMSGQWTFWFIFKNEFGFNAEYQCKFDSEESAEEAYDDFMSGEFRQAWVDYGGTCEQGVRDSRNNEIGDG